MREISQKFQAIMQFQMQWQLIIYLSNTSSISYSPFALSFPSRLMKSSGKDQEPYVNNSSWHQPSEVILFFLTRRRRTTRSFIKVISQTLKPIQEEKQKDSAQESTDQILSTSLSSIKKLFRNLSMKLILLWTLSVQQRTSLILKI